MKTHLRLSIDNKIAKYGSYFEPIRTLHYWNTHLTI